MGTNKGKTGVGADGRDLIEVGGAIHHLRNREDGDVSSSLEVQITTPEMRAAVDCLERLGSDGSWLVFMFNTHFWSADSDDVCLNLQYSIEEGRLGMDWVLLGQRNLADREKVSRFARRRGHNVRKAETNGVVYLRVEDGDIRELGRGIAEELYGMASDSDIGLMVSGFSLPAKWRSFQ